MRFVLNFNHACTLKCPWCYVKFDGSIPNKQIVKNIIDRCAETGFNTLTLGGGDPYQYNWIGEILKLARTKKLFVHIDTNAIKMSETNKNIEILNNYVDLIGIPLDGSNKYIHDLSRKKEGNFDLINKKLNWLSFMKDRLKINTFAASHNINDLINLSFYIKEINPKIWSIYQYWSINNNSRVTEKNFLNDTVFGNITNVLKKDFTKSNIILDASDKDKRRKKYPIITHNGDVYIHHNKNDLLLKIGSIFLDSTIDDIIYSCQKDNFDFEFRYS